VRNVGELRFVERADVLKQGRRAATLTRSGEGVAFSYLPHYDGPPVATTLPLGAPSVVRAGGAVPAFFAGLLPEGRRLGALRREAKTSADDELTLLLAVGADAIGDVQVVPEGEAPTEVAPAVDEVGNASFEQLLADLGIRAQRVGLPGVQDKVSAAMLNLPVSRRGAAFILKLNPPEFPHLVENEAVFLRAAKLAGLQVPRAQLVHDRDGLPGLLVERFDRDPRDGTRRAVEDGCQVLDLPPADKYRTPVESLFGGLARVCGAPLPAARTFLSQLVFAYLTGNGDAHAKNFSVLQDDDGEWRPSPVYDVPSSYPYGDTTMALRLNGRTSDAGAKDFVAAGSAVGLPEKATRQVLDEHVARTDAWLPLLDELPFDTGVRRKLTRVVKHRRDRLL
jgi:serine/threonine-protein kinase HipA